MVFDDCGYWKLWIWILEVDKCVEIDWNNCDFEEVVEEIIGSAFFQVFEELFSQNTDGTLSKFL